MGFDPRHWSGRGRSEQRVTSNVEALLAENDALRREVARLTRELELVRRWRPDRETASAEAPRRIHPAQIEAWGAALAGQAGWGVLRQSALNALVDQLNRDSFPAQLTLQQRLDRLAPGLGHDLMAAIGARRNKKIAAVLAAFALYGVRASEWLALHRERMQPAQLQFSCFSSLRWQPSGHAPGQGQFDPVAAAASTLPENCRN